MTATDCQHKWIPVLGGGFQCADCGLKIERDLCGLCPITSCRRPIDDHIGIKGLDHPICPGDLPLPPPCGPVHREKRK